MIFIYRLIFNGLLATEKQREIVKYIMLRTGLDNNNLAK